MATIKTSIPANWVNETHTAKTQISLLDKFGSFAESQKERITMWFFLALIVQGVFFLPLPAFLMYYYNAPMVVLFITLTCFFTTIIAYMGGGGIKAVLALSAISILIQVLMSVVVVIA